MSRSFSMSYMRIEHRPQASGSSNISSKEVEVYKKDVLIKSVVGKANLSRMSKKILGFFIDDKKLSRLIKSGEPFKGYTFKYKDKFIF